MKPCVIFNPAARGEKARHFIQFLTALADECALKPTDGSGHAVDLAAEAFEEGYRMFIAAGGDGTVNEIINGIGRHEDGFAEARLGILPFGTVNVFAKELGIPDDLELAWKTIRTGKTRRIDLAEARFGNAGAASPIRYFAQLAGAGLDAQAIKLVDWEMKKKFGPLAYVWAGLQALNRPLPDIQVTAGKIRAAGKLVLIGNGKYYGGRFEVFPQARLDDGKLDVCVFPETTLKTLVGFGVGQLFQNLPEFMGVQYFQTTELELTCSSPAPFEVEGDVVGKLPVKICPVPSTLSVLV